MDIKPTGIEGLYSVKDDVFSKTLDEAHEYAKGLSNPAYTNWVTVEWAWV